MTPAQQNPETALVAEVLAQARQQADETVRRARQTAQALLDRAAAEAGQRRQRQLEAARTEAARRKALALASVPIEVNRLRLARVESLLQSVREAAFARLQDRTAFDYGEALANLAVEALTSMDGNAFVVSLAPGERAVFGDALAEQIRRRTGRGSLEVTVADEASATGGGVRVEDPQGRQVWDNRFEARLARLWPELRRQLAVATGLLEERSGS